MSQLIDSLLEITLGIMFILTIIEITVIIYGFLSPGATFLGRSIF